MTVTKDICDRCGEELKYVEWTARFPFPKKRPLRFNYLKLHNGNPSGYDYSERRCELCPKCTLKFDAFLRGRELACEQSD